MSCVDPAPVPSSDEPAADSGEKQASIVVASQSVVVSPVDRSGRSRYRHCDRREPANAPPLAANRLPLRRRRQCLAAGEQRLGQNPGRGSFHSRP